jgi:catechol 2,3-dioxygenase-like lactoylglutathione lyase family enzyme
MATNRFQLQGLDHIQIAMPIGQEARARAFYTGILGLLEIPKPAILAVRGGVWFACGHVQVHLSGDADFHPAKKAHPAFCVANLAALLAACEAAQISVQPAENLTGIKQRAFIADPFGNRIELLERGKNG